MALLQLIGYAMLIVASLVLGIRLIALSRRTREWPELLIGWAFILGGGLGYAAWLVAAVLFSSGSSTGVLHYVTVGGLSCTCAGAFLLGIGNALVYRSGERWPRGLLAVTGAAMAVGVVAYAVDASMGTSLRFWWPVLVASTLYAWGAFEAFTLVGVLARRARLGLADPLVVNRTRQWGISGVAIVLTVGISFTGRLVYGPVIPPWVGLAGSMCCLVAAGAIWLGFFPPAAYRERLLRAVEA